MAGSDESNRSDSAEPQSHKGPNLVHRHHPNIVPANHGAAITEAGERTQAQEREDRKAHVKEMEHARNEPGFKTTDRNPIGKDSGKQASVANKLMDSRKAHNGVMQSDR
ncbi:hypothetical protein COCSUDRAFT_45236 [Coccomyxa subellipsoidea C-169]|uniref:Uncharacterized protein n=1 Tax=Coccomyxa subellipsoidea (strain C-169) TaxID=574566 RepID=I0YK66_COCSC|nr:hypothetical protein COCSUDRAFT_45236 [Coccomyxa subellipsoidea C-169]EIE18785.1 hypothetical protein COCSUDRAFT_45236 [Coccomyxa subellipsoidea C-169]|eukprot:XP_005643329.1 hypothetical protein COCSUDRAFT_45236 [Coccomyxa subellipsoidea C-169]